MTVRLPCLLALAAALVASAKERHFLYVAEPGIRNYVEYGGIGVLVFDMDNGYKFVKRIPTWTTPAGKEPENVKGIAASARTGKLYVSTLARVAAFDLVTGKMLWDKAIEGGCDRLAIAPDGKLLYVPSFEGPHWTVVDAGSGNIIAKIITKAGAHNTIYSLDGSRVYMAGLKSPVLSVATRPLIR
jgi:DNA-binding beta-propeller fold protein YncE